MTAQPFNKTLYELWKEAGERPFQAVRGDGEAPFWILGQKRNVVGCEFIVERSDGKSDGYMGHCRSWRFHVEAPKPVPYWPAIIDAKDGGFLVTDHVYADVETARQVIQVGFIRLATELPPIMLVPGGER